MYDRTYYNLLHFPKPTDPTYAIFMDFDETYRPISPSEFTNSGVFELEEFFTEKITKTPFLCGWITGSNIDSALKKAEGYCKILPHFISSSLGSEFYWINNGVLEESEVWNQRIYNSGFNLSHISELLQLFQSNGISLVSQSSIYQGKFKRSYYLSADNQDVFEEQISFIKKNSKRYPLSVLVTKCNPAAGDPENTYDVEFIPLNCGKDQAVKFVLETHNILLKNSFAFGDSCNDLAMFSSVGNAYWVANADSYAKSHGYNVCAKNYCHGILESLETQL